MHALKQHVDYGFVLGVNEHVSSCFITVQMANVYNSLLS